VWHAAHAQATAQALSVATAAWKLSVSWNDNHTRQCSWLGNTTAQLLLQTADGNTDKSRI
jgi:hypothetical protein